MAQRYKAAWLSVRQITPRVLSCGRPLSIFAAPLCSRYIQPWLNLQAAARRPVTTGEASMAVTDYRTLIDSSNTYSGLTGIEGVYAAGEGVLYRSADGSFHEAVRLSDRAYLFMTEVSPTGDSCHTQVVEDNDWLHVQFRFKGSGFEHVAQRHVETPERSCIVSRYPQGSVIEREIPRADTWKYACLYLCPSALTSLLDIDASMLPETSNWMAVQRYPEFRCDTLPLFPALLAPLSDIFACTFRGHIRRAYMRAKSLEILSTLVHALDHASEQPRDNAIKLRPADLTKLALARSIMAEHLESPLSLADLGRRVGLNRTKLALGFKATYGDSVQAYWRDARLVRARELLQSGAMEVTEAAFSAGYSETSSFTRAFTRKFGVLPKTLKRKAANDGPGRC
jgi:AraC-like DNA-binding protein